MDVTWPEWNVIHSMATRSLASLKAIRMRLVMNTYLWNRFNQHKESMTEAKNEQLLFHMTRDEAATFKICTASDSSGGFDFRLCGGNYGTGVFFAENIAYNTHVHPRTPRKRGTCKHYEVIVATVALGHVFSLREQVDSSLRRPPPRAESGLFDSVHGTERNVDWVAPSENWSVTP